MSNIIGSSSWLKNRYHIETGGVNLDKMRTGAFKPVLGGMKGAIEVTISKEAKELAKFHLKNMTAGTIYDK